MNGPIFHDSAGGRAVKLTDVDTRAITAVTNFLSWGLRPARQIDSNPPRPIPPAVWAYMLGFTSWCPPLGEL